MKKTLILVDCQYGFCEGGNLPVEGAMEKMNNLSQFIEEQGKDNYHNIILTADFHPYNHCSFKENGGDWPMHCVAYTHDASIVDCVFNSCHKVCDNTNVFTKGTVVGKEEYSVFGNYFSGPQVLRDIKESDVIEITGIMSEVCVLNTIKDLVKNGFKDKLFVHTRFAPTMDDNKALVDFLTENEIKFDN